MKLLCIGLALTFFLAFPSGAHACRQAEQTDMQRLRDSEAAFIGRVTGVQMPAMERKDYVDRRDVFEFHYKPRTVRLMVLKELKGKFESPVQIVVRDFCDGSLSAEIGNAVDAYKFNGHWRLYYSKWRSQED